MPRAEKPFIPFIKRSKRKRLIGIGRFTSSTGLQGKVTSKWTVSHNVGLIGLVLAHSVQYAYKLVSTRCALEKTSLKSYRQDQARATASNPPDPP
eukprot:1153229-Pelagomonas_calceolata.AAC.13